MNPPIKDTGIQSARMPGAFVKTHKVVQESSNSIPGSTSVTKAGLCWLKIKNGTCPYGEDCTNYHISLSQFEQLSLEDKKTLPSNETEAGVAAATASNTERDKVLYNKLCRAMRKTRLCLPYREGKCKRGTGCDYVHATGDEAWALLALANSKKDCPQETVLGICPAKVCFFLHEKRQNEPVKHTVTFFRINHGRWQVGKSATPPTTDGLELDLIDMYE